MKVIIFIVVLIAALFLIPDRWISDIFMRHISIAGDGEEAMNDYEFTIAHQAWSFCRNCCSGIMGLSLIEALMKCTQP